MSVALAVLTSDPNLVRCELHRLEGQVALQGEEGRSNAVGIGAYAQDDVLLRRFPRDADLTLESLAPRHETEALLFQGRRLPVGLSLEENTQPFRSRRWLFAHQGQVEDFASVRAGLLDEVPDFLKRQIRGETDSEVAFALFLKRLWETGHGDDPRLPAEVAGRLLMDTARSLSQASARAGAARTSTVNLLATNGYILVATRLGGQPVYYTRLEGTDSCEVCGLTPGMPDTQPGVVAHRRRRSVVVATHLKRPAGWVELAEGTALTVEADLQVRHVPPAP
ncbi:glutamine amidotransferase [Archangium gephyra]|uniref:Glutamine amidotransferase n=1 Tax=Archangium gephyra TaxID=48 RepID=A0AAC8QD47_9BACT|nr:class II glutamine amidotransferase [Archangium gephyra]AKJ05261.1 Glutamine amidotransferases class-II [Archangium gephyra]REG35951.1 glutamine amidotransferase [Archangium gephyra]